MADLKGQVVLVTGASSGIGKATAAAMAECGATVIVNARGGGRLGEMAKAIGAHPIAGDVTDEAFVTAMFAQVEQRFGRLDVLVNNAGVAPFGKIEELPVAKLRQALEVNIVGVFLCMQAAVRLMRRTGDRGRIINVGSVRSHWTENGDAGAYNASKYGLRGMVESVARQLHGSGSRICVGLVCPGVVDTPLTNPKGEPRPDWLKPRTIAEAIVYAAAAPEGTNVFDLTLFSTAQKPW